ncbi:MAG TPA: hypothetical protein PKM23_12950, partial [bacterium]|nr:hypothetical protein [bacterium]
ALRRLELILNVLNEITPHFQGGMDPIFPRLKTEELEMLPGTLDRLRPIKRNMAGEGRKNARRGEDEDEQAHQCHGGEQQPVITFFFSMHGYENNPWFMEQ